MKQEGFSLFPLHFQVGVEVLKGTLKTKGETQTILLWALLLILGAMSASLPTLSPYVMCWMWFLPWVALGTKLSLYLKFQVSLVWAKLTKSLPVVQPLKSFGVLPGEFEEMDSSCWFILLMVSAVCVQRSAIISCVFPEWFNSQKWSGEQNLVKILRLSWSCVAGLNSSVSLYSIFLLGW